MTDRLISAQRWRGRSQGRMPGARQEGVYFAASNFAGKCSGAIGPLVAGIAIDIVGLDPTRRPAKYRAAALFDFGLVYAALAVIVMFATRKPLIKPSMGLTA